MDRTTRCTAEMEQIKSSGGLRFAKLSFTQVSQVLFLGVKGVREVEGVKPIVCITVSAVINRSIGLTPLTPNNVITPLTPKFQYLRNLNHLQNES